MDLTDIYTGNQRTGVENMSIQFLHKLRAINHVQTVRFEKGAYIKWDLTEAEQVFHDINEIKEYNNISYLIELTKYHLPIYLRWIYGYLKFNKKFTFQVSSRGEQIHISDGDEVVVPGVILSKQHQKFLNNIYLRGVSISFFIHDLIALEKSQYSTYQNNYPFKKYLDLAVKSNNIYVPSQETKKRVETYIKKRKSREFCNISVFEPTFRNQVPYSANCVDVTFNGLNITYVSSLIRRKNHIRTAKMFANYAFKNKKNIQLILVAGSGNMFNLLAKKSRSLKNEYFTIRIFKEVEECCLSKIYDATNISVYLSSSEGYGMPIRDSIERKIPVICSDIPVFYEFRRYSNIFFLRNFHQQELTKILNQIFTKL